MRTPSSLDSGDVGRDSESVGHHIGNDDRTFGRNCTSISLEKVLYQRMTRGQNFHGSAPELLQFQFILSAEERKLLGEKKTRRLIRLGGGTGLRESLTSRREMDGATVPLTRDASAFPSSTFPSFEGNEQFHEHFLQAAPGSSAFPLRPGPWSAVGELDESSSPQAPPTESKSWGWKCRR